jgi:hypothetical protein
MEMNFKRHRSVALFSFFKSASPWAAAAALGMGHVVYVHACVRKQPRIIILFLVQLVVRAGVSHDACSHSFWSALMINANFKSLAARLC